MINSVKARTSILALILFVFTFGQAFAADKVVDIPMFGLDAEILWGEKNLPALPATISKGYTHNLEQVTSTRSGHWMVTQSTEGITMRCASGTAAYFFSQVDYVPIRSSIRLSSTGEMTNFLLTGISENIIPAGNHIVSIGSVCVEGSWTGVTGHDVGTTTVVVIPK